MATGILAFLAALLAALPAILNLIEGRKAQERKKAHDLANRSLDELSAGDERVRGTPPVQPRGCDAGLRCARRQNPRCRDAHRPLHAADHRGSEGVLQRGPTLTPITGTDLDARGLVRPDQTQDESPAREAPSG